MRNSVLFQGEKYLKTNKNYFEGWYFKNTNDEDGISFIPGINVNGKEKKAFIQVVTVDCSYYVDYSIEDFEFNLDPFWVKVGNSFFSKDNIHIDISDHSQKIIVSGDIQYSNSKNIDTNFFKPNIMGPFSYVPFLECNHAILSMKSSINGLININNHKIKFNDDIGYIEKDWGCSFPKSYIWCQGNNFKNSDSSFVLSIADIPFKIFSFRGIICSLIVDNKEYRFATYNNTKLVKYDIDNNYIDIVLKRGKYSLNLKSEYKMGHKLFAPVKGKMEKGIFESISAVIIVTLKKDDLVIFSDISTNCGLEIVHN